MLQLLEGGGVSEVSPGAVDESVGAQTETAVIEVAGCRYGQRQQQHTQRKESHGEGSSSQIGELGIHARVLCL